MSKPALPLTRRQVLCTGTAATATALLGIPAWAAGKTGRFQQAAALGPFKRKVPLEKLLPAAVEMGLAGFDLVSRNLWPDLKKHGLICTMSGSHSLTNGLCEPANHEGCLASIRESVDATAAEGWPNVICFSGNRRGIPDEVGLKNCIQALKQVAGYAEKKKVTLCLEFLNSSVNHKDYMADTTAWNVALVHGVGSERVKVLYDIYHAGCMKENILKDIREHHACWGHYHTAGVPGRNEISAEQTLDYPAIMQAIAATGFDRYVAHEFSPKRDPLTSLREAVQICNV